MSRQGRLRLIIGVFAIAALALLLKGPASEALRGETGTIASSLSGSSAAAEEPLQAGVSEGGPIGPVSGLEVDLAALPQATPEELAAAPPPPRPQNGMTDEEWANRKDLVREIEGDVDQPLDAGEVVPADAPVEALAPVEGAADELLDADEVLSAVGALTPGATKNFQGQSQVGPWVPPDMALAVGRYDVLQVVNTGVAVYNKNGALQAGFPKSPQAFFGMPAGSRMFDPRAIYDWGNQRFVVVMLRAEYNPDRSRGFVHIAVSKTPRATGSWYLYSYQMGPDWQCPDYPGLGHDLQGVYITANRFTCDAGGMHSFAQVEMWLLKKSLLYTGTFAGWWAAGFNVGGTMVDTIQPASVDHRADHPRAEFAVNSFNINFGGGQCLNGCSGLVVWAISNPFGFMIGGANPRFTGVTVPTSKYYLSFGAHQPTCDYCVDVLDPRITGNVKYSRGSLFASVDTAVLNTGPPQVSGLYWWEIRPFLNDNDPTCTGKSLNKCPQITSATVVQEDCFVCGGWANSGSASFATLQPDAENNLTMVFEYSSKTHHPGVVYTSRRVTQSLNRMHDQGVQLQNGLAHYGNWRWGDYTDAAVDLQSLKYPMMWFSGMYSRADGTWGTKIGRNGFTQYNQP